MLPLVTSSFVCLISILGGVTSHGNDEHAVTPLFRIHGTDFVDSKTHTVCMLAELDCEIQIFQRKKASIYKTKLPQSATTIGSYCDVDFVSMLQLSFNGATLGMKFVKTNHAKHGHASHGVPKYCEHCNVGNWNLMEMNLTINNVDQFSDGKIPYKIGINSSASYQSLADATPDITAYGVDITRAFSCSDPSKIKPITMDILNATNANEKRLHKMQETWDVRVQFLSVKIQPFLVRDGEFNDPYLCSNLFMVHALIVLVPILYFVVLVLIYRARDSNVCPIYCKRDVITPDDVKHPSEVVALGRKKRKGLLSAQA